MIPTFEEIEQSIRKYFIIDEESPRVLANIDRTYPEKPQNPIVVFVAISSILSYPKKDIIDFLKIGSQLYTKYVYYFVEAYNNYQKHQLYETEIESRQKLVIERTLKTIANLNKTSQHNIAINKQFIAVSDIISY
jgi:hypothetical protein